MVDPENLVPSHTTVSSPKNPTFVVRPVGVSEPCDENYVRIRWMHDEPADLLYVQKPNMLPRLAAVDRFEDSIADTAQDIAGMMVARPMTLPDQVFDPLINLATECVNACNHLNQIMEKLEELVETGFRGPESEKVMYMIDELNKIETGTDVQAITVMRLLFKNEEEIGAVSTIMWDRVIHWVGDLANYAERAGNRHRLLLAR